MAAGPELRCLGPEEEESGVFLSAYFDVLLLFVVKAY